MSIFRKLEYGMEQAVDTAAGAVFHSPIEPAQIAKRAEKQMKANRLVGTGHQYAPTLYNVLVNKNDDERLFGFYPTIASEIETYLTRRGTDAGLEFDCRPLVRFLVDGKLKSGRFDVIAENVSAPVIAQLREEELEFYGIAKKPQPAPYVGDNVIVSTPNTALQAGLGYGLSHLPEVSSRSASLVDDTPIVARPPQIVSESVGSSNAIPASASNSDASLTSNAQVIGVAHLFNQNSGQKIPMTSRLMTCGRDRHCDIALDDANASRRHACFEQNALGAWSVTDLQSTNGTQVNGKTVERAILRSGDALTIGTTVLEFWQEQA
ncbi:MAG: DUF3662 domain-containing protein [Coriobacteriales bacterium]|nr:DUF3662 domain-containing protein [Coriobacteriales bacterium]